MKKIAVCCGKSCGPAGSARVRERLEKEYADTGINVLTRDCCGRCERSISIEIDDSVVVSDLTHANLEKQFINNPETAIEKARKEHEDAMNTIDAVLDDLV